MARAGRLGKGAFTHTVVTVADGRLDGWAYYNSDVLISLLVHPNEGPFERGAVYVWCKPVCGFSRHFWTTPIFGRFIEWAGSRPKVLVGRGKAAVLGPEYTYCFRPVGTVGFGSELYTRSEIPVPVPDDTEWQKQPEGFDMLQHHVRALDGVLSAMATVTDMVVELDDADKSSSHDQYLNRRYRRAEAYTALDGLLSTAMQRQEQVEKQLADFLATSPKLAKHLARWQAQDAKI